MAGRRVAIALIAAAAFGAGAAVAAGDGSVREDRPAAGEVRDADGR